MHLLLFKKKDSEEETESSIKYPNQNYKVDLTILEIVAIKKIVWLESSKFKTVSFENIKTY